MFHEQAKFTLDTCFSIRTSQFSADRLNLLQFTVAHCKQKCGLTSNQVTVEPVCVLRVMANLNFLRFCEEKVL